jgi:hypothetical protein
MHDYSKQFNHLAQYAPDQVDTDEKDRFMIGLSTKLQERMTLNTGGTFPEFVSNVMITDDAIRSHKETKKRKVVAAPSSSAPLKYRTVYHHGPTYPPRTQHQHQRPQQQWAPRPPLCQHQQAAPKACTSACDAPACTTDHWSHLRPHLLQLWLLWPLRSRVHCAEEDSHAGPRHPSTTWSSEGGYCKDWTRQLHYRRRCSRGRTGPRWYVLLKRAPHCHSF